MKPPRLRLLNSTRSSVLLSWSPMPAFSSSGSSSSLLLRTRQSRSSLSSEDRKISRTSLGSADTSVRKSLRTPMESTEDALDSPGGDDDLVQSDGKQFYTVEMKDLLQGGYKSQVEVSPLSPGEVHHFRVKVTQIADSEESDWSDTFTTATKDDVLPAASLHRALEQCHMSSARKVLALRISALEIPNRMGRKALAVAAMRGDTAISNMLLSCGGDVTSREIGSERTPLMVAAFQGATDIMHALTEKDANWSDIDRFGQTSLHYSCMQRKSSAVQMAIKDSPDVNAVDNFGWSPLMLAVTTRSPLDSIKLLLDAGADVNSCDSRRQTTLMQAVLLGYSDAAKLLVARGADIEAENREGHTAYDFAKQKAMDDLLPLLECCKKTSASRDHLPKKRKQSQQVASISPF